MRRGLIVGLAAVMVLSACGSGSSESTEPFPPTSELIFVLSTTTTTTRPPSQSDPVPIEALGVSVSIPRDWVWETESIRYGAGAAAFQAENRAGGLIIVGDLAGLGDESQPAPGDAQEAAGVLATLLNLPPGAPQLTLVADVVLPQGRRTTYAVVQEDGTSAVVDIVLSEEVFVAFLYEDALPENRIAQGEIALTSLTIG